MKRPSVWIALPVLLMAFPAMAADVGALREIDGGEVVPLPVDSSAP